MIIPYGYLTLRVPYPTGTLPYGYFTLWVNIVGKFFELVNKYSAEAENHAST